MRGRSSADRGPTVIVGLVVLGLALLVATPVLLRSGLVLTHDLVMVPDQPLTWSSLGAGPGVPRAVPVDAVVSVLSVVFGADVLQKVTLVGLLLGAGLGAARVAARLAGGLPTTVASVVAAAAYLWNPYVAERLLLGHWWLLVGYAALPWLVQATWDARDRRGWAQVLLLAAVCALSATGGVLAAVVLLVLAGRRRQAWLIAVVVNLPWVVPGLLSPAADGSDPAGVAAFALRPEGWSGPVGAALGLGGIWSEQVVPLSRSGWLAPLASLALVGLAMVGVVNQSRGTRLRRRPWRGGSRTRRLAARAAAESTTGSMTGAGVPSEEVVVGGLLSRLLVLWLLGLALALAPVWPVSAVVVRWAVEHLPGAGILRDSQKWLALAALPTAVLASAGAGWLGAAVERRLGHPDRLLRVATGGAGLLLVILTVPELAWGAGGRLAPVHYPPGWAAARHVLAADPDAGAVLSLPFQPLRVFPWNDSRPLLDPAPRWFAREVVVDDRLSVGGPKSVRLAAENSRTERIERAVSIADLAALRAEGIRFVLVARNSPGAVPAWVGTADPVLFDGGELQLIRLDGPVASPSSPLARRSVVLGTDLGVVVVLLGGALVLVWRPRRTPSGRGEERPTR